MRTLGASEFKAHCLAVLDEVARTGEGVTVLKRGRPVAQIVPPVARDGQFPQHNLVGTVQVLGDIVSPVTNPNDWEALKSR